MRSSIRIQRLLSHLAGDSSSQPLVQPAAAAKANQATKLKMGSDGKLLESSDAQVQELLRKYGSARSDSFQLDGLNHVAIVCADMKRTVEFYGGLLGLPLLKTIALPEGGQHFFFDAGRGGSIAFFWFPNAPKPAPPVTPEQMAKGEFSSGPGSTNHLCFNVPGDKLEEYSNRLKAAGVKVSPMMHHTNDPANRSGFARKQSDRGVFISSLYFWGPDGEFLELCAQWWPFDPKVDIQHLPLNAAGKPAMPK